jgi:hypothetical protein
MTEVRGLKIKKKSERRKGNEHRDREAKREERERE